VSDRKKLVVKDIARAIPGVQTDSMLALRAFLGYAGCVPSVKSTRLTLGQPQNERAAVAEHSESGVKEYKS